MTLSAEEIIGKCLLFKRLSPQVRSILVSKSHIEKFEKNRSILRQGQMCPGLYCVGEGGVRVYKLSPKGKEHMLHYASPGSTFAEVAVLGDFPCPAYADAAEDTICAVIPAAAFRRLLADHHEFCLQFVEGMAGWVRQLVGLLEDVVLRDAAGRVAGYLLRQDEQKARTAFTLPVLKKDLASHLNLTTETLSRTLRRLAEAQLIEMPDAQQVRVLNHEAMEAVAQGLLPAEFE
jgi:CRP/FNR family transcriptional regulator